MTVLFRVCTLITKKKKTQNNVGLDKRWPIRLHVKRMKKMLSFQKTRYITKYTMRLNLQFSRIKFLYFQGTLTLFGSSLLEMFK